MRWWGELAGGIASEALAGLQESVVNDEQPKTPEWVDSVRHLEEQNLFLDKRQDELLAAIDDLAGRVDALNRRLSQMEQRIEARSTAHRADGAATETQGEPGQPA